MTKRDVTARQDRHILIVEDSLTQAEQLRYILEKNGYGVSMTRNGRAALDAARERIPLLVISDIMMPEMDGYALCREMKQDENLKHIPVMLLTSLSDPVDVVKGLECGADNFMVKPYDEKDLLSRINYILANRDMHQYDLAQMGVEIYFAGQKYFITSDRLQILNLLLSTYETAVQKNLELIETQNKLRQFNEHLEEMVQERTAELEKESAERRRAEEKYRSIFENAVEGMFRAAPDGRLLDVNPSLVRILAYPSAEALLASNMATDTFNVPDDWMRVIEKAMTDGKVDGIEIEWKRQDDKIITIQLSGRMTRDPYETLDIFEGTVDDITERRSLEVQLRQAQKMEAIGRLAGGVAHDFNNLLTVILGYADIMQLQIEEGSDLMEGLEEIRSAGQRAASLTQQLLAFSRRQVVQPQLLSINEIVKEMNKMLYRLIGEDIRLITELDPDIDLVKSDKGQMEQVLMNLAVNARDAMPEGGTLTIETTNVVLSEDYTSRHLSVTPGPYVLLAMSDTGCGMNEEIKSHIFEPFFTTKEQGKGTGLGLSTVHGIVTQWGGAIWVYSEVDQGTTIKVYLPRNTATVQVSETTATPVESLSGTETILLVEDDEGVRILARMILEAQGYTVLMAENGQHALEQIEDYKDPIHLVLSDLIMPGMSGPDLIARLKEDIPCLAVLFMSGYTDRHIHQNGILETDVNLLQKPFSRESLARKVRETLDRKISENLKRER